MNKDQILKYKDAFDYWLGGGDLWCRLTTEPKGWIYIPTQNDIFPMGSMAIYVQDDEYVELRKAQADGKTIQFKNIATSHEWIDIGEGTSYSASFGGDVENYCIKPDEPTFKVGDWVLHTPNGQVKQLCVLQIRGITQLNTWRHYQPWQPKENEWCVFHNGSDQATIARYKVKEHIEGKYCIVSCHGNMTEVFNFCEPFLGELPTNLKGIV